MIGLSSIAPARPVRRVLSPAAAAVLLLTAGSVAVAQQHPKAAPAKPATPAKPPAGAAPAQGQQAQQPQMPKLIYSPWTKLCGKGKEPNAKQSCFTIIDGRLESGVPVAGAALVEQEGEAHKVLRVTLPLAVQLKYGTRVIIDQDQPMSGNFVICFPNGCMADLDATDDLVKKLKAGHTLTLQAVNMNGVPISLPLPLAEFAKAHDGPPTDPKELEARQKKLQEELQKRAEEARKKLESEAKQPTR
jgi:invasion protein IalB